jgi:carboxypeptidase Q
MKTNTVRNAHRLIGLLWILLAAVPLMASEKSAIDLIKEEGLNNSQVMKILWTLTDDIGPRLTGSPALKRAHEWTRDQLTQWGLQNAHLEEWGPFGRGWTLKRFTAEMVEPQCMPITGVPKAWSPGLKRPVTAEVVYINARNAEELAQYKGKLKGKIVLHTPGPVTLRMLTQPLANRLPDEETSTGAGAGAGMQPERRRGGGGGQGGFAMDDAKYRLYEAEGVALIVETAPVGEGVSIRVMSARVSPPQKEGESRKRAWDKDARILPQIIIAPEHYNRMVRLLQNGKKVELSVNMQVEYQDKDLMGYNTIAEIPGTDLADEVVMIGAHLDSWHAATGATDNGTGSAVCLEAMRILQASGLKPRRTIRIALWGGEEQGLLGSRAYVEKHFAKRETDANGQSRLVTTPAHDKFCAYFNDDNGSGRFRGINMQGNDQLRPVFATWLEPFHDMGATRISPSRSGSTDHTSFDAVGLPGFQFIQDSLEYFGRTWHTNQDHYDRAQEDDLKQGAVIMAAFAYQAAMRDERLPRRTTGTTGAGTTGAGYEDDHDHNHDHGDDPQ